MEFKDLVEARRSVRQAGLMLRIDHENWIKAGIEFVDGHYNVSAVVTHGKSDWSVIKLEKPMTASQRR